MELPIFPWPVAVLLLVGLAVAGWGLVTVVREQQAPRHTQPAVESPSNSQGQQPAMGWGGIGCMAILLGAAIVGGIGLLDMGLKNLEQARASTTWPTAAGHIVSAKLIEHDETNDEGEDTTYYSTQVSYAYAVNGISYTGQRISFGSGSGVPGDPHPAQSTITLYPPGTAVTVYYDPENPQEALLEPGENPIVWGSLWLAGADGIAVIGLLLIVARAVWKRLAS